MATHEPPRLALDEDVRRILARLLRDRGWDAVSVVETGRLGLPDEDQLDWATHEHRILVTHNAADFATLAANWLSAGRTHAGLFIARQAPIGWLLSETLKALAQRPTANAWNDQTVWAGTPPRRK